MYVILCTLRCWTYTFVLIKLEGMIKKIIFLIFSRIVRNVLFVYLELINNKKPTWNWDKKFNQRDFIWISQYNYKSAFFLWSTNNKGLVVRGAGFWRSIWSRHWSCEKLGTVIYIGTYVCSMYISIGSRATRHYDLTSILCDSLPPPTLVLTPAHFWGL